MQAFLVLTLNK